MRTCNNQYLLLEANFNIKEITNNNNYDIKYILLKTNFIENIIPIHDNQYKIFYNIYNLHKLGIIFLDSINYKIEYIKYLKLLIEKHSLKNRIMLKENKKLYKILNSNEACEIIDNIKNIRKLIDDTVEIINAQYKFYDDNKAYILEC